jgi:hypothetical protein
MDNVIRQVVGHFWLICKVSKIVVWVRLLLSESRLFRHSQYGGSGGRTDYLQTWLQGGDARADARATLQFEKQVFRLSQ